MKLLDQLVDEREEIGTAMAAVCDVAAEEIAAGIGNINKRNKELKLDVLIVGRGGGSLEDLWAFNEEVVARAIFNSAIPIISAVGHEMDTTIADLVAGR